MGNIFALVYIDFEEFYILEMGNREFILRKYNERINQRKDFEEKYKDSYDKEYNFYNAPDNENERDDYFNHKGRKINNIDGLCIQGYKDGIIQCMCREFGINKNKTIWY